MSKALSFTAIFQGNSLNYGEGIGNISELKKFHRANGEVYTFASRQSLRYDVVRLGNELFQWNLDVVDNKARRGVVQFKKNATIEDSGEMDLFGYLKTSKESQKRPAVARLSHAFSLEPYRSDMEFLNSMGLAERINEKPDLANIEQHQSLYTYTLTIDLNKVGIDGKIELDNETRATRIRQLLDIMKVLYRDIRGRREDLSPLFVIGGVYDVANPFFFGKVQLDPNEKGFAIHLNPIQETMEKTFAGRSVGEQTQIGILSGLFDNEEALRETFGDQVGSIESFFSGLQDQVSDYYGVSS